MNIFTLHTKQNLPISMENAWDFFSDPKNLGHITPPHLGFKILSEDRPMYAGQIIEYTVTPLLGIKMNWVSEITHVDRPSFFVDEQRFGPYSLWHHKHFIKEIDNGVEIEDIVHYKLPMGFLGEWVHPFLVKPKLDEIFKFRKEKLIELFGDFKP